MGKIKLNAMEQTPIDLSRPWEHFSVETEEREMDQKMIKVIEGMPADVQGRFKGLYMLSNQCTTIGDQMDREMEAMEVAFLAKTLMRSPMKKRGSSLTSPRSA